MSNYYKFEFAFLFLFHLLLCFLNILKLLFDCVKSFKKFQFTPPSFGLSVKSLLFSQFFQNLKISERKEARVVTDQARSPIRRTELLQYFHRVQPMGLHWWTWLASNGQAWWVIDGPLWFLMLQFFQNIKILKRNILNLLY